MKVLFFLSSLFLVGQVLAAPDEEILGKAEGYPLCQLPQAMSEQRCLVALGSRFDEITTARKVARGAAVRELKRAAKEPELRYTHRERAGDVEAFLANSRNTGLLVLRGDTILVERYQYERKPEQRMQSYSMAKTVVAMLVGIALAEKKIASIDDRADAYVAELKGHPYGETSLRHLLTMSSGVRFSEAYDGRDDISVLTRATLYHGGPGGAASVLSFTARARLAGERFVYASAETQVLALVLRAATGATLADYLSEKIWQPMGAEADASWLLDKGGFELGYMGLNATVRDWARLGMLLANDGALDGQQIIPAEWVRAATQVQAPHLAVGTAMRMADKTGLGYGYQTWLLSTEPRRFALIGVRGQAVFVDPASKLVVVHTSVHARYAGDPSRGEQFSFFNGVLGTLSK